MNVAQEAVVRMKQFAMKTNSDQQQRMNATQVRHGTGPLLQGSLCIPLFRSSQHWRLYRTMPVTNSSLFTFFLAQRALSAQTKKWKSAIAELKTREMDLKTKSSTVEDLKQSLVETRKELAKEVKDSGGGGFDNQISN